MGRNHFDVPWNIKVDAFKKTFLRTKMAAFIS